MSRGGDVPEASVADARQLARTSMNGSVLCSGAVPTQPSVQSLSALSEKSELVASEESVMHSATPVESHAAHLRSSRAGTAPAVEQRVGVVLAEKVKVRVGRLPRTCSAELASSALSGTGRRRKAFCSNSQSSKSVCDAE